MKSFATKFLTSEFFSELNDFIVFLRIVQPFSSHSQVNGGKEKLKFPPVFPTFSDNPVINGDKSNISPFDENRGNPSIFLDPNDLHQTQTLSLVTLFLIFPRFLVFKETRYSGEDVALDRASEINVSVSSFGTIFC